MLQQSGLFGTCRISKRRSQVETERVSTLTNAEATVKRARHNLMEKNREAARLLHQSNDPDAPQITPPVVLVTYNPSHYVPNVLNGTL